MPTEEYDMFDCLSPVAASRTALPRATLAGLAGLAGLAANFLTAGTAAAATPTACLTHDKLVDMLDGRYAEQRIAVGLESGGRLFEVFAKPDGSTWTMVVTTAKGASCVVAAGMEWQKPDWAEPEMDLTDPEM